MSADTELGTRVALKNILFLTDFSEPSQTALPFALALAREYGAVIHALHILLPEPYSYATPETTAAALDAQEDTAREEMQRVDAELSGLPHQVTLVRGVSVWEQVEQAIRDTDADVIVLGTHGRTGAQRLLLGSVAEEIFRHSEVPVMTIGPGVRKGMHSGARFRRVLFPTDFSAESLAGAPYAISLAQENEARLTLLHVVPAPKRESETALAAAAVSVAMHRLHDMVPPEAELWCRPETVVEFGEAAEQILRTAVARDADLIVLGVRSAKGHETGAAHFGRAIAHTVVAAASCPVLTVRG